MLRKSEYASEFFDSEGMFARMFVCFDYWPWNAQEIGEEEFRFLHCLWRIWKGTCKANIKSYFLNSCARCFDGDRKRENRQEICYQIHGWGHHKQVTRYRTTPDGASPGPLKVSKSRRFVLQSRRNNL
jgi:hypothetical protein